MNTCIAQKRTIKVIRLKFHLKNQNSELPLKSLEKENNKAKYINNWDRAVVKLNNKYNPRVFLEINNRDKIVINLI